jgi:hypothetical protein
LDPISEDEEWLRQLNAQAPFPCDWKGQLFWDSEAAKHAQVIDYYLRDGKARLEGRVRDLQHLLAQPGTQLRAADVGGTLQDLRTAINRDDPHYRYEFSTSATAPTVRREPGLVMTRAVQLGDGGSTWTTGALVLRPEAPDDALDAIGPDGVLVIGGEEWVVAVGQVTVPLGPCYRVFFHPRIAEVHALEDGSRRVVFEPGGDGPGRVEERLGLVPGNPEPPT